MTRGPHRVLLIDDDAIGLMARQALLESRGYEVLTSDNDTHAIETLKHTPVHLVISDHYLRGTTGGQVATRIKQVAPDTPVLVVSGAVQHELPADFLVGASFPRLKDPMRCSQPLLRCLAAAERPERRS